MTTATLILVSVAFCALLIWVYWPGNRDAIESRGRLPFDDEGNDHDV